MSRTPSSTLLPLHSTPTNGTLLALSQHIDLIDHTRSKTPSRRPNVDNDSDPDTTNTLPPTPSVEGQLLKRLTNNSLNLPQSVRREYAKQKYSKYSEARYGAASGAVQTPAGEAIEVDGLQPPQQPSQQPSSFESYKFKAKALLQRRRTALGQGKHGQDTTVDVLYENQRGTFLFGVPRYSSASLLPSDPRSWQNADLRTSPVDITNAQVPDPSWEWGWKCWYVDMSRDVDEEGWEYSFMFKNGWNWHGNHPWFHSFVRRRRWLRMRKRRPTGTRIGAEKGHELTAEYFTIHPQTLRPESQILSPTRTSEQGRRVRKAEAEIGIADMEITDIASLLVALRRASLDREKLLAVRKFLDEGGDELFYLGDHMGDVMRQFIYQSSRRQLLSDLLSRHSTTHGEREDLNAHDHRNGETEELAEHKRKVQHAENLHKAIKAAEIEVKGLEYWSDVKSMADEEQILQNEGGVKVESKGKHPVGSFSSKQRSGDGLPKLHPHAHRSSEDEGKQPREEKSVYFDASAVNDDGQVQKPEGSGGADDDADNYTTAAESVKDLKRKAMGKDQVRKARESKGKARGLDGVAEDDDEIAQEEEGTVKDPEDDSESAALLAEEAEIDAEVDAKGVDKIEIPNQQTEGVINLKPKEEVVEVKGDGKEVVKQEGADALLQGVGLE